MFSLTVFAVLTYYVAAAPTTERTVSTQGLCVGKPADMFFLVDSSTSIRNSDFKEQMKFVASVVELFPISQNETRVGVGIFSSRYYSQISFEDFKSSEHLKTKITNIKQRYGNTETGLALNAVRKELISKARPEVSLVVIVLTDGVSQNSKKTIDEAKLLKDTKAEVFAIGIGNGPKMEELKAIGSTPSEKYVYSVSSFKVLKDLKSKLANKTCKVPAHEPYCTAKTKTDVMFAFDPRAMGVQNTRYASTFVGDVIQNFGNMDDGTVQAGLLAGYCEKKDILLNRFSKKEELIAEIRNSDMKYFDQTLNELHLHSFTPLRGGRIDSRHIAVILIDENVEKFDNIISQIIEARRMDIEVFVVAIGNNIDLTSLENVVTPPSKQHLLHVPSYESLHSFTETFSAGLCNLL